MEQYKNARARDFPNIVHFLGLRWSIAILRTESKILTPKITYNYVLTACGGGGVVTRATLNPCDIPFCWLFNWDPYIQYV